MLMDVGAWLFCWLFLVLVGLRPYFEGYSSTKKIKTWNTVGKTWKPLDYKTYKKLDIVHKVWIWKNLNNAICKLCCSVFPNPHLMNNVKLFCKFCSQAVSKFLFQAIPLFYILFLEVLE